MILLGIFPPPANVESLLVHDKFSTNCYTNKRQSFIIKDSFIFLQFRDGIKILE